MSLQGSTSIVNEDPINRDSSHRLLTSQKDSPQQQYSSNTPEPPTVEYRKVRVFYYAIIFSVCLAMVVVGIVGWFIRDDVINSVVRHYVIISSPKSPMYDTWLNPGKSGVHQFRTFTFFNLTNPVEVATEGVRPNFNIVGPYVYEENVEKIPESVEFFDDGRRVRYKYRNMYKFRSDLSIDKYTGRQLSKKDYLHTINVAIFGLRHRLAFLPSLGGMKPGFCWVLNMTVSSKPFGEKSPFTARRIEEILWGYVDPIWNFSHPFMGLIQYYASTTVFTEWNHSYVIPTPYTYRSGQMCPLWQNLSECNGTANMDTVELTGVSDSDSLGELEQWAGQKQLWWWGPELDGYTGGLGVIPSQPPIATPNNDHYPAPVDNECNMVRGTNGMKWGPINVVKWGKDLRMFLDMFWRDVIFSAESEVSYKGIDALRFGLAKKVMKNSPENQRCHSMYVTGLFNFTRPIFGPLYAAKSMMLDVEPENGTEVGDMLNVTIQLSNMSEPMSFQQFRDDYLGYKKDIEKFRAEFDSYLDVHPLTGVTLRAVAQGMAVTDLGPIIIRGCPDGYFPAGKNLPETMFPLVIIKRMVEIPDHLSSQIRTNLQIIFAMDILLWVIVALGVVGAVTTVLVYIRAVRLARKELILVPEDRYVENTQPCMNIKE